MSVTDTNQLESLSSLLKPKHNLHTFVSTGRTCYLRWERYRSHVQNVVSREIREKQNIRAGIAIMNKSWFSRNIKPVNCLEKSQKFSLDICTFGCYFGEISLNLTWVHCKSITIFSRSRLFRHWICFLRFSRLGYVSLHVRLLVYRDVYLFTLFELVKNLL